MGTGVGERGWINQLRLIMCAWNKNPGYLHACCEHRLDFDLSEANNVPKAT